MRTMVKAMLAAAIAVSAGPAWSQAKEVRVGELGSAFPAEQQLWGGRGVGFHKLQSGLFRQRPKLSQKHRAMIRPSEEAPEGEMSVDNFPLPLSPTFGHLESLSGCVHDCQCRYSMRARRRQKWQEVIFRWKTLAD